MFGVGTVDALELCQVDMGVGSVYLLRGGVIVDRGCKMWRVGGLSILGIKGRATPLEKK